MQSERMRFVEKVAGNKMRPKSGCGTMMRVGIYLTKLKLSDLSGTAARRPLYRHQIRQCERFSEQDVRVGERVGIKGRCIQRPSSHRGKRRGRALRERQHGCRGCGIGGGDRSENNQPRITVDMSAQWFCASGVARGKGV